MSASCTSSDCRCDLIKYSWFLFFESSVDIVDYDRSLAVVVNPFPIVRVKGCTRNSFSIVFCLSNESKVWWKCCPDHHTEKGPDVSCEVCYAVNHPTCGALHPEGFGQQQECGFPRDHDGIHSWEFASWHKKIFEEGVITAPTNLCSSKRAAAYGIDASMCHYPQDHEGPHSWVVT